MIENGVNNGVLDYGKSRRKKVKDSLYETPGLGFLTEDKKASMAASMGEMSEFMNAEQQRWSSPVDGAQREKVYMASARDYIVPEDNELRRRRQFVMSDKVVNDAVSGYYDNSVSGVFESEKASADKKSHETYRQYASVVGADPLVAAGAMRSESDPKLVIKKTMQQLPGKELDEIADSYARYAGLSPDKYRKAVLEPAIEQRMLDKYVDEATPKSSLGYIARSAYDNSLTGKLVNLGQKAYSPTSSHDAVSRAGLAAYDANRVENLAAGIGSLVVDMPAFAGIGGASSKAVGGVVSNVTKGLSKNLVKKYAARGMQLPEAERIIERAIIGKMGSKIAQGSAMQGFTLGGYDAANSMADDLLYNDGIDVDKAVDAYAHGFTTGVAVGAVGTPLKELSRGLTGGKKIAASAGSLGAESAVFTMASNADKLLSGVEVEPIDLLSDYAESVATLGAMKLAHWRPKGGSVKLGADGKLKQKFRFTPNESRELINAGVDPRAFISGLEETFKTSSLKSSESAEAVKSSYLKLMENKDLSAATRSKLLYLVENKITSTPPVAVDCAVEESNGTYNAILLDAEGRRISTQSFGDARDVETFLLRNRGELRKNKIASYEDALLGKYDSENFFRQAGRYAEEKGVDINSIAEAIYKKGNNLPLNAGENKLLDDISRRTSYGDKGVGRMLYDIRRQIEREYNLKEGSLLAAVERKVYRCSSDENKALDKYLERMQQEVAALENGTSAERYVALESAGEDTPYGELGNEALKAREKERYANFVNSSDADWINRNSYPEFTEGGDIYGSARIKVPEEWNKPYAWSYNGLRNSYEDMNAYKQRAEEIAAKLGRKLNFYFDERDIKKNSNIDDYNRMINAAGWIDNTTGKVYINLPNIRNIDELERVVVHEVVGHGGLSNLFGEYVYDFYEDLYKMADEEVRAGIHDMGRRYSTGGYTAVEEYLAHLAEKSVPTRKERTILNRLKDFVNNMLVRMKIISSDKAKVTTDELCNLLSAHHSAMYNRVKPDAYRARVFNKFPSARHSDGYYNTPKFNRDIENRIASGKIFEGTPQYLLADKHLLYDNFSPAATGGKSGNSYRFIGERGVENISEAENGRLGDQMFLEIAKEMERDGATPQEIWRKTMWARGADGLWRGEIDYDTFHLNDFLYNKLMVTNPQVAAKYRRIQNTPRNERSTVEALFVENLVKDNPHLVKDLYVRDVVTDPVFYAAYPELADIPVEVSSSMREHCYYDPAEQVLFINRRTLSNPKMLARQIVKPMQQMIQHYEGFENSVSMLRADAEDIFHDRYLSAINLMRKIDNMKTTPASESLAYALENSFKLQHGVTPGEFRKLYPTIHEYILAKITGKPNSFMGNVEVRNVYNRQGMNGAERLATPPFATEDYPRANQISLEKFSRMEKMLDGPLDVIYRNVEANGYNHPMRLKKTSQTMDGLRLTPLERRILEAQYDEMSSQLAEAYIELKEKNRFGEHEALRANANLMDELAMNYIKDVSLNGILAPNNVLKKAGMIFSPRYYKIAPNDAVFKVVENALRRAAARRAGDISRASLGNMYKEDAEAYRAWKDDVMARSRAEWKNSWNEYRDEILNNGYIRTAQDIAEEYARKYNRLDEMEEPDGTEYNDKN